MLEGLVGTLLRHWPYVVSILLVLYFAKNHFNRGLNKFPGPFLGSLTDWWRFLDVWGRRPDITHRKLHEKYGDFVRLGPNCLSIADPKALKTIYGLNKGFVKSEFYPVQQPMAKGVRMPSLFSTTDEQYHAQLRRCVNSSFSMSAMVQYEGSVDVITRQFLDRTSELYARTGKVCEFATWLQFLAFDVIGHITYSKSHGFVERNEDVDGMVAYLGRIFSYAGPVGQQPWLDVVLIKNPVLRFLDKYNLYSQGTSAVVRFAKARMAERFAELNAAKEHPGSEEAVKKSRGDLLEQFLKAQDDHPEIMNDTRVLVMATSMAFAGSETTAITLAAIFYYLLRNPKSLAKLRAEFEAAIGDGRLRPTADSQGMVTWAEAQRLPYLDACVKEAFRLHPAAGLPLERIVPPGGAEIAGQFVPGGTIVGCSAWVLHKREDLFGPEVDAFRPERWTEAAAEKRKEMEAHLFQFGMGSRTCIGKNISLLEVYKLVPSFLRRFDISFADPNKDWRLYNAWFVKQHDFYCQFQERQLGSGEGKSREW